MSKSLHVAEGDVAVCLPADKCRVNKTLRGAQGFEAYYAELYNARWQQLKAALLRSPRYITWTSGGTEPYFLDSASLYAALMLPLSDAKRILDLCAAPGGKTLVLASRMDGDAVLTANELSAARYCRLVNVLNSCLPESVRMRVQTTKSNGAKMCLKCTEQYERILLDVPCSSERHVLADKKYLLQWSSARIKTVSMEQWALLSSAYRMLASGGYILYSTCALSPAENDAQIERLLVKFDSAVCVRKEDFSKSAIERAAQLCGISFEAVEKTAYGFHILPDVHNGAGPIYFSLIRKLS